MGKAPKKFYFDSTFSLVIVNYDHYEQKDCYFSASYSVLNILTVGKLFAK